MSDTVPPAADPTVAAAATPSAAPTEPMVAPAADPAPAPAPAPADTATEPAAVPSHTDTASLLTQPAKPAEDPAAAPDAAAPTEAPAAAEPAAPTAPEPLTYEAPTLPEGVTLAPERLGEFDRVIGTHQVPPEARQELVDMFLRERTSWEEANLRNQHEAFAQTRQQWREQVMGDEEIGGSGHQTAIAGAMRMIDQFVAPAHRDAFDKMLVATGAGDHPEMIRFLHNVARKFDAPPVPLAPNNPPPDRGNGGARRMRDLYDNPRSRRA